jgi:hypothetical protein
LLDGHPSLAALTVLPIVRNPGARHKLAECLLLALQRSRSMSDVWSLSG